jgi:uncharacterized membrane protein
METRREAIWKKLSFWVIVSALVTVAVIVYGFWLPTNIEI